MNAQRVSRGHSTNGGLDILDTSAVKVKRRELEQARRRKLAELRGQISIYFLVSGKKVSAAELLLFGKFPDFASSYPFTHKIILVVVYLRIGVIAFPGLVNVLPLYGNTRSL
jgi:hypothetical protein